MWFISYTCDIQILIGSHIVTPAALQRLINCRIITVFVVVIVIIIIIIIIMPIMMKLFMLYDMLYFTLGYVKRFCNGRVLEPYCLPLNCKQNFLCFFYGYVLILRLERWKGAN